MYFLFSDLMPARLAIVTTAAVYAAMLFSIIYCSFERQAEFNYLVL